jgi:hypothetical protein
MNEAKVHFAPLLFNAAMTFSLMGGNVGVQVLQFLFGHMGRDTLHIGDQFSTLANDLFVGSDGLR